MMDRAVIARKRLEKLMSYTFKKHAAAIKGANDIRYDDCVLAFLATEGCDFIGVQGVKRNRTTSKRMVDGHHVFFNGNFK